VEGDNNDDSIHGSGIGGGLGCRVSCHIGHSQGNLAVMKLQKLRHGEDSGNDCAYINLAGRFMAAKDLTPESIFTKFQPVRAGVGGEMNEDRLLTVTADDIENRQK